LALTGCFGNTGMFPAAQDAQLIVKSLIPIANSLDAPPATLSLINRNLATATSESAALAHQFAPNLLDVQEFYGAAQTLLTTLSALPNLPAQSIGVVDAATALLPTFTAVDGSRPPPGPFKMSAEQARALLGAAPVVAASPVAPPAVAVPIVASVPPPPRAPAAARFHMAADDLGSGFHYEFSDGGQVMETGQAPNLRAVEARFDAFKKQRLAP
jgi:hypothetical protein